MHRVPDRRQFLQGAAAASIPVVFAQFMPPGLRLLASAQAETFGVNPDLKVLSQRPLNAEVPAHLLDDAVTPAHRMFVRNNGLMPEDIDVGAWRLEITGHVNSLLTLSIADLKRDFEVVTLQLQMECGGNGRQFFSPSASGNQWTFGAIACPRWTGVRLKDVLALAGLRDNAVYTGHYGADDHLSGDPDKEPISRGVPIAKALEKHTLIAWAMNDAPIPLVNGHPLRLIAPGWPGSCSQKWLTRIDVRDRVHDGAKMGGKSYRVPRFPVGPGSAVDDEDMEIIESMPVKSLITFPETGTKVAAGQSVEIRGHAWAGDRSIARVEASYDFGRTWQRANLSKPANRYAWQHFEAKMLLSQPGYYEIWARARDDQGVVQPPVPPEWNPRGYLNNMQHRIAVFAV